MHGSYSGLARLVAGLCCGLSGLAAGMAIGVVGDAGVRAVGQQEKLFCEHDLDPGFCGSFGSLWLDFSANYIEE
ncbi:hypothetical protein PsorP6_003381 [Peronosclerospora sorghi]|uniref:Uncharacterized protein n=1 Tax=Peronosclerospora sorghi TaxID=230839 RepID=A0ACC0VLC2_9STRA|nr:hypothetical protein PsorP6_003381 [Peronosclerospora sorghi]